MAAIDTLQVFQALNRSPNARLVHSAELGDGLSAALWTNHHDAQDYEAPTHHTLSCYIAGGTGTFRRDQPGQKGGPDKLCILPAEHESGWVINGDIRLAHLYFSAEQFALGCVTLLDREPREMQLREQTFLEDPQQAQRFRQLLNLNWQEPAERLLDLLELRQVVCSRRLKQLLDALERAVFEAYTDTLQTRVDTDTPEEMRWLVMFPKLSGTELKSLRDGISLGKMRLDHRSPYGRLFRYFESIALPLASITSDRKMTC